ncbi:MAG: PhoH family protein [Pseudomonadota bacterium]|nr:PhoH family protein [Pseudomonadota bacterium]
MTAPTDPHERVIDFNDSDRLREVAGELGKNLQLIGRQSGARVSQRGTQLRVVGTVESVGLAVRVLEQLYALASTGTPITLVDVDQACRLLRTEPEANLVDYRADVVLTGARKRAIYPRTPRQKLYVHSFEENDVVFGVGPAGTGKTYLAMAVAVSALLKDQVRRIVLCRPAVEAGEKLGFLPGDLAEKVNPYLRPLYDALYDMVDEERAARLIQKGVIEVAPLAFMRGRTLNNAFIILDEAQNTTAEQMKMFLTRLGNDSRAAVTGDLSQVDLPRHTRSGLVEALRIVDGIEGIGIIRFRDDDIVRHPLVSEIVRAYDRESARVGDERPAPRTIPDWRARRGPARDRSREFDPHPEGSEGGEPT